MARPTGRDLRNEILDLARDSIQRGGVSAFSFGTIAKRLDVAAPTIHHHFRTKAELIEAVTARYRDDFDDRRDTFEATDPVDRLRAFAALFVEPASSELVCLCGAVAAAGDDAPAGAHSVTADFFDEQIEWIRREAARAVADGRFARHVDPLAFAGSFIATLEGSLVLARAGVGMSDASAAGFTMIELASVR